MCPNPKCKCQKLWTFIPKQFQLGSNGFKRNLENIYGGTQTTWNGFLKPALNMTAPDIGMALASKITNHHVGHTTTNILKSFSLGKIMSSTDMHVNGLRLTVIWKYFNKSSSSIWVDVLEKYMITN